MATYDMEEFYQQYNKPQIGQITVGFSGIDPAPKGGSIIDIAEGSQAAQNFVQGQINDYLATTTIAFDGGEIG
ncbi:MAG: hypothetical protein IJQ57_00105 [Synergistaceae bacterium]|nr:hypothetical protein [Synergistaceae bacterium]